jgi:uncharacterized protein (TIGR03067 family)
MTRFGMTLLTVGLVLVIGQARAEDKADKEKLQGEWVQVGLEVNGESVKVIKDRGDKYIKLMFEGNKLYMTFEGNVTETTFAVDSSKEPKTIDITSKGGDKSVLKGLYELDLGTLKICTGDWGSDRPPEIRSTKKVRVYTYKLDKELDKLHGELLQGEWTVVSFEGNGKSEKITNDNPKFKFEGNKIYFSGSDGKDEGTFAIHSSKNPKTIDLTFKYNNPRYLNGIYELDGDTLKICIGIGRPAEFKSAATAFVYTCNRVKK